MTHTTHTPRKFSSTTIISSACFVLVGLGIWSVPLFSESGSPLFFANGDDSVVMQTEVVVEAPFDHAITAKGIVNSQRFANLESEVDGYATVLWLIPPGAEVYEPLRSQVDGVVKSVQHPSPEQSVIVVTTKDGERHRYLFERKQDVSEVVVTPGDKVRRRDILAGDIVCRLDASELELKEKNYEIRVNDYLANFEKSKQDVEIRRALNESKNSRAKLNAELAQLDLEQYLEGTYPQQIEKLQGQIQQSREDLKRAEESYQFTQRVATKGYKSEDEVEKSRLKVLKLQHSVNDQQKSLDVLEDFNHHRDLLELSEKAENLKREEKRIRLMGEAAMAQYRMILASRERVYNIYKERLNNIRKQVAACTIVAPQAGQVIYATEGRRTPEPTAVGQKVRERQDLIHLPDLSDMKVDARIHESLISHIHEGLPALITVDSLPGEVFESRISELSAVPMPGRWPNYDRKEYHATLEIDIPEKLSRQLRPGMTANVEILVEQINEPVIQVPMQSIIHAGTRHFLWVATASGPQQREIEVGHSNDETFIVIDGVQPGEQVVVKPLDHFSEEIAELRERYAEELQPTWQPQEIAQTEEEEIPQSEEEFLTMIGFYADREADAPAAEQKSEAVSSIGD